MQKYSYEQVEEALCGYRQAEEESVREGYLSDLLMYLTPLLYKKIRHYFPKAEREEREDLLHDGYLRSIELILAFDPARGIPFLGYMKRMLGCFYFDRLKAIMKRGERCSFDEEYMAPEQDPGLQTVEIVDLLRILNEKEERILRENILLGRKLKEVADRVGISYVYAKEVKRKALKKLRKSIEEEGEKGCGA